MGIIESFSQKNKIMYSSKLAQIFFALAKTEQRALGKFLKSPYYNHRQDVVDLYTYLYKTDPEQLGNLRKEKVYKKAFKRKDYDPDEMDYVMSFLLKLTEQFLIEQQNQSNKVHQQLQLARAYNRLKLHKPFHQTLQNIRKKQKKQTTKDIDSYRIEYEIEFETFSFSTREKRTQDRNLQALGDKLDLAYIAQKLKQGCIFVAQQYVYDAKYQTDLLDQVIIYINKHPDTLVHTPIALYYYYYQTITIAATNPQTSQDYFQNFRALLADKGDTLQIEEFGNLFMSGINYCIHQMNTGNAPYIEEALNMYKIGLEKGILLINQKLSYFTFKNIVDIALKLNYTDWTSYFIETYQDKLDEKMRDSYSNYALAKLYYKQHKYQKSMLLLQQLEYAHLYLVLASKVILLKIYYELSEYDALDALLASFNIFISRKQELTAMRQSNYKNIIRLTKKLLNVNPFSKEAKKQLEEEIQAAKPLTERDWLLKQLSRI